MRRCEFLLEIIQGFLAVPNRIYGKVEFLDCLKRNLLIYMAAEK